MKACILCAVVLLALTGCSVDRVKLDELKQQFTSGLGLDAQWQPIDASQARLGLDAPGIESAAEHARLVKGPQTRDWAKWRGGVPWAELHLTTLSRSSQRYFSRVGSPGLEATAKSVLGEAEPIDYPQVSRNDYGDVEYQTFKSAAQSCVVFRQYPGVAHPVELSNGGLSLGNKLLLGAYCAKGLPDDAVKTVLRGVRLKG